MPRQIWVLTAVAALSGFAMRSVWSFMVIYAVEVIGLTKTMAKELAPYINVNTVAPGHTKTEMTAPLPDEVKQNMIEGSYLKRMAEPEDIAKAVLFMSSDDANFITGQILLVDGGFSLKRT